MDSSRALAPLHLASALLLLITPLACGDDGGGGTTAATTSGDSNDTRPPMFTETDIAGTETETGTACTQEVTEVDADTVTSFGGEFSANDILAAVGGTRTGTLTWSEDMVLSEAYRGTALPVSLEITYDGGAITLTEASMGMDALDCVSHLEIEVTVALTSDSGEFAETRAGILRAYAPDFVVADERFALFPPPLTGALDLDALVAEGLSLNSMELGYVFLGDTDINGVLNGSGYDAEPDEVFSQQLAYITLGEP